jgi:hypothetical protein
LRLFDALEDYYQCWRKGSIKEGRKAQSGFPCANALAVQREICITLAGSAGAAFDLHMMRALIALC